MTTNSMKALAASLAMVAALTACRQGNTYSIDGTAEGFSDGDTLFLTSDMYELTPLDTAIVSEGHFSLKGETDSTGFFMVYSQSRPDNNVQFFLEPGNIAMTLSTDRQHSRVGGTATNDAWQQLNDTLMEYGRKMQQLPGRIPLDNPEQPMSDDEQKRLAEQMQSIANAMKDYIVTTAEENIDNELGYFILVNFDDYDALPPARWQQIVSRMPEKYRQRPAMKELEKMLSHEPDLSACNLPQPDGTLLSVTDEIGRHKLTLLDFWASWCGPCRGEMPAMKQLYATYKDQGLGIVGISLDNDADAWKKGIKDLGITWPQVSDLKGWEARPAQEFQVRSIPHIVVVDAQGNILAQGLRGQALEQFVKDHL